MCRMLAKVNYMLGTPGGRRYIICPYLLPPMTGRDAVVVARHPGACLMYDGMSKGLRTGRIDAWLFCS